MLKTGDILDEHYLIDQKIGEGGFSVVFRAYDLNASKAERAVKEIHGTQEDLREKIAESILMAELSKSNTKYNFIPNIIDRIPENGVLYIVMDYIDGIDMSENIKPEAPLPYNKVIEYSKDICAFMSFMHEKNYLFSDMKPENIMILRNDENGSIDVSGQYSSLKFVDFGATINEGDETTAFSPAYAAPEQFLGQFNGALPDKRTDIFNIGATIFHMATGYAPENVFSHEGNSADELRKSFQRFIFPEKSDINNGLKRIIMKCTADDRNKRYSSCSELLADLERLSENRHVLISCILAGISAVFLVSGIFTMVNYKTEQKHEYKKLISISEKTDDPEEKLNSCVDAINILPDRNDGYLLLLDACSYDNPEDSSDDMYFTNDEKDVIIEILAANQSSLEKNHTYAKMQYEIGKLIWYYGLEDDGLAGCRDTERTRIRAALSYFDEVINYEGNDNSLSEEEKELAEIYYHIADYLCNYQKRIENGDKNEPVSLDDIRKFVSLVNKNNKNDYIRLETYYCVLDLINESIYYYEDTTEKQLLDFYNELNGYIQGCGSSGVPHSDSELKQTTADLCMQRINELIQQS